MTTAKAITMHRIERCENFPVETLLYLEAKIQKVRKTVMKRAAEISSQEDMDSKVYHVKKRHINKAFNEFVSNPTEAKKLLGLKKLHK